MLHVILLILKILLWIILGLVSLVLLLLLLVLFAPITYSADIKIDDNASVAARIRFLILSVRLDFDKNAKSIDTAIRVFGIRLGGGKESTKKVKSDVRHIVKEAEDLADDELENEDIEEEDDTSDDIGSDDADDMEVAEEKDTEDDDAGDEDLDEEDKDIENDAGLAEYTVYNADRSYSDIEQPKQTDEAAKNIDGEEPEEAFSKSKKGKKKKKVKRQKKIKEKESKKERESVLDKVNGKLAYIKKKLNRVERFWNLPCTVKLRTYLKKYIPGLFRHISPRKIAGHVRYGFNEPCKTGQVTGYLSLMPFVYQKNFYLQPDFYNKVLEGEVKLKGRLMLGYILRIALNINVWRTIKVMRKI